MADVTLNLDALAPKPVEILFQDKLIQVAPPTLEQYMKIVDLSKDMNETDITQNKDAYSKIADFVKECIPDLKDVSLNFLQLTALFKLLAEMSAPNDDEAVAELKKRGINLRKPDEQGTSPKA